MKNKLSVSYTTLDHIKDAQSVLKILNKKEQSSISTLPHIIWRYSDLVQAILEKTDFEDQDHEKLWFFKKRYNRYMQKSQEKEILTRESHLHRKLTNECLVWVDNISDKLTTWSDPKQFIYDYLVNWPWSHKRNWLESYLQFWIKPKVFQEPWNIYQPFIAQEILHHYQKVNASWNLIERFENITLVPELHPSKLNREDISLNNYRWEFVESVLDKENDGNDFWKSAPIKPVWPVGNALVLT